MAESLRNRAVRCVWGPSWREEDATLLVFQRQGGPRWWNRLLSHLDRYLCLVLPHSWTAVECVAHEPSHALQWICMRCNRREDEGCPAGLPRPTASHYRRASKECERLSDGTNGNIPIQSVYEVLVRVQLEAVEEVQATAVVTGSSSETILMNVGSGVSSYG